MKKIFLTALGLAAFLTMSAQEYVCQRPAEKDRLFKSETIEKKIDEITAKLVNPKLAWMFSNCYPNTLDTTVHHDPDVRLSGHGLERAGLVIPLYIRETSRPCGSGILPLRYGHMWSSLQKMNRSAR